MNEGTRQSPVCFKGSDEGRKEYSRQFDTQSGRQVIMWSCQTETGEEERGRRCKKSDEDVNFMINIIFVYSMSERI